MAHTILVIDGEPMQMNVLCTLLKEKLHYQAVGVTSSREAIHHVMDERTPKPDLIIIDVSLIEGYCEVIANLRILTVHTPIIALVKYGDYAAATAVIGSGAQDFLSKPVTVERLGATLSNTLRLRDAQREVSLLRREHMHTLHAPSPGADSVQALRPFSMINEDGSIRRMDQIEAEAIRFAMQYYNGRMTEVARRLGIGRSTLYRKLSELSVRQQQEAA